MTEMPVEPTAPRSGAVLYAKSMHTLAEFYAAVACCTIELAADDHVVLVTGEFELTIVAIPKDIAQTIDITDPPQRREQTPLKLAFVVDDLERARLTAAALGGVVDPSSTAWTFRGSVHCDGHDPEGNVFQLLQATPVS